MSRPREEVKAPKRTPYATATVSWRAVVWVIFGAVFFDAASLTTSGGGSAYRGVSYDLLRLIPGGMRVYGIALGLLLMATINAYGKAAGKHHNKLLRLGLASLSAWYVGWMVAICMSWLIHGQAAGFGGLGRTAAFAAFCLLASLFAPHDARG